MKKLFIALMSLITLTSLSYADLTKHAAEISEKEREKAALANLKSSPNTVQIFTKGLICESCGLGIRKKLQKLKFVDTSKPKKGIVMDVKSQLISLSLKQGESPNLVAIKKAIKGAGYDPITLYELKAKKLKSVSLKN